MAKNSIYTKVFEVYGLTKPKTESYLKVKTRNENIRTCIKKQFIAHHPDREWSDLSKREQDIFVYLTMREKMFKNYVLDSNVRLRLGKKLDNYIADNLLNESKLVDEYNQNQSDLLRNFYPKNASEKAKQKAYKDFCIAFKKSGIKISIPTYEEWTALPLRIYDYIKSFEEEENRKLISGSYNYLPSNQEIDHIVLQVIIKQLREKLNIEIDINDIEHCLYTMKKYESSKMAQDFEFLKNDVDNTLNEEQKELEQKRVAFNREYVVCKRKIDNLDFVKESETE